VSTGHGGQRLSLVVEEAIAAVQIHVGLTAAIDQLRADMLDRSGEKHRGVPGR
jgi:hypothetical protein